MIKKIIWQILLGSILMHTHLDALPQSERCLSRFPSEKEIHCLEARLIRLVNQERGKRGLKALCSSTAICAVATRHSKNMAASRVSFGHGGFEKRAQPFMKGGGHIAFGENVAFCDLMQDPLKTAVDLWMHSLEHRKNILGDYNETGIGIAYNHAGRCFMTQLFAKRQR